jgi:hypothetical protein
MDRVEVVFDDPAYATGNKTFLQTQRDTGTGIGVEQRVEKGLPTSIDTNTTLPHQSEDWAKLL